MHQEDHVAIAVDEGHPLRRHIDPFASNKLRPGLTLDRDVPLLPHARGSWVLFAPGRLLGVCHENKSVPDTAANATISSAGWNTPSATWRGNVASVATPRSRRRHCCGPECKHREPPEGRRSRLYPSPRQTSTVQAPTMRGFDHHQQLRCRAGRPLAAGHVDGVSEQVDQVDADFLTAVFAAARQWEMATGRRTPGKVLRESLWFVWQAPRLPRPLVRSKYPRSAPWTAAARAAYLQDPSGMGGLVMEHVQPISVLIRTLLDTPQERPEFIRTLNAALQFCVVTTAEDKMLAAAKVGSRTPESRDRWVRYRLAGIDVDGIQPLDQPSD